MRLVKLSDLPIYAKPAFFAEDWNGFKTPFFTKEQCYEIVEKIRVELGDEFYSLSENGSCSLFLFDRDSDYNEEIARETRNGVHYYALGGGSWTWIECEEKEARFQQLKQTILENAPFGRRDWGHISKLECMQCENACEEAVEEIIEILESNPDFDPCLDDIIDALWDGNKDELAEKLEDWNE